MAQETKDTKVSKTKKSVGLYFKEIKSELKKVIWPDRAQLVNNTFTVLAACFIVGLVIWVADVGFEYAFSFVFNK